ncbi:hypothetical protein [Mitsuokella jalaludinii]|uniref:hypothetical protein n=1 Tax=Mitsuokella jalaludinii TaxID=187979 RepID=UPI00307A041B
MGRFAKALSRKHEKNYKKSEERAEATEKKGKRAMQHATTKQIIRDRTVMAGAYDTLTLIFDVAVHETFGWGVDMRARLHKKMARHILCMKSHLVTTKDIERILRDEADMEPEKEKLDMDSWGRERRIQYKATGDLSAIFLLSLLDEFGYKTRRLKRVYDAATKVANKLKIGSVTVQDLEKSLTPRGKRVLLD